MFRTAMNDLVAWKDAPGRKPLLLFGARQVGKSHLLSRFAHEHFEHSVLIDLEERPRLRAAFEGDITPRVVLDRLAQMLGMPLNEEETLIVIDEIQASGRAVASLKYFQEQLPTCPIIGAGSLLGVAVGQRDVSLPVGKVHTLTLYPMTFDEFLVALGRERMLEGIRDAYQRGASYALHEEALELYRAYLLVGGMPEAVATYRDTGSLPQVRSVHRDILNLYLADMAKYARSTVDVARARDAWASVPAQLAKDNHKFQYRVVRSGGRASQYAGALDWLCAAGLVTKCVRVSSGQVPLSLHEDRGAFKAYANDTGLLSTMSEVPIAALLDEQGSSLLDMGGIAENYAVQQLVARGITPRYWTSGNTAEVDLVVEDGSAKAVPIEVKSSANVRSRSLGVYAQKYDPVRMVRLSTKNLDRSGSVESVALYAAGALADDLVSSRCGSPNAVRPKP